MSRNHNQFDNQIDYKSGKTFKDVKKKNEFISMKFIYLYGKTTDDLRESIDLLISSLMTSDIDISLSSEYFRNLSFSSKVNLY